MVINITIKTFGKHGRYLICHGSFGWLLFDGMKHDDSPFRTSLSKFYNLSHIKIVDDWHSDVIEPLTVTVFSPPK